MGEESLSGGRYGARGVSASKEEVHEAIAKLDKGLFPRSFCKVMPDLLGGDPAWCVVMHADGAGTKSSLAYAYWRETGDLSVWEGIAQDAIVMNLDDLLCVGICDNILLSSTIGRNKRLIPGEVVKALIEGTEAVCARLREYGVNIELTGGETADVGDLVRTVIVDSTVVSRWWVCQRLGKRSTRADTMVVWGVMGLRRLGTMCSASGLPRSILRRTTASYQKKWCIAGAKS